MRGGALDPVLLEDSATPFPLSPPCVQSAIVTLSGKEPIDRLVLGQLVRVTIFGDVGILSGPFFFTVGWTVDE